MPSGSVSPAEYTISDEAPGEEDDLSYRSPGENIIIVRFEMMTEYIIRRLARSSTPLSACVRNIHLMITSTTFSTMTQDSPWPR